MCLLLDRRAKLSETVPPNRSPGDLTAAVGWTNRVDSHQGLSLSGKHPGTSLPHLQCFILRPNSKATLGHRPQLSQAAGGSFPTVLSASSVTAIGTVPGANLFQYLSAPNLKSLRLEAWSYHLCFLRS